MTDSTNTGLSLDNTTTTENTSEPVEAKVEATPEAPQSDLVGEGRKYASYDALEQGYSHASEHIRKLEEENAAFRQAEQERKNDELISKGIQAGVEERLAASQEETTPAVGADVPSEDVLASTVRRVLDEERNTQRTQGNLDDVNQYLRDSFGEGQETVATAEAAKNLGMALDDLVDLAAKSPEAFKGLVKRSKEAPTGQPIKSSVATERLQAQVQGQTPTPVTLKEKLMPDYQLRIMEEAKAKARREAGLL